MNKTLTLCALVLALAAGACKSGTRFAKGADISWETELEARGYTFANQQGQAMECTQLMKHLGLNAVRLRVWVDPANGYCGKADVLAKALRAKALGMDIMIDFHYSDSWADPGKQFIPKAWEGHTYDQLLADVASHTEDVLNYLKQNGIEPRWVQVGNETTHGLLWPVGKAEDHPAQYAGLIAAGCQAVKRACPKALTIVHLDNGFDRALYEWNLGILKENGVDYDLVAMSLYPMTAPEWHADKASSADDAIDKCFDNIPYIYNVFGKETIIAEVGVRVTQPFAGRELLMKVMQKAQRESPHCLGVFYWEPEAPHSYNGGYDMGAFQADGQQCRPTIIMDAFKE